MWLLLPLLLLPPRCGSPMKPEATIDVPREKTTV
jgi:hypothetical protein